MTSTRLLRVAEGVIAAARSNRQSPQPSDELKAATFELLARSHFAASRRIPNEGAGRAAAARLRHAVQYDTRVLALAHQATDRRARAHARLAVAFSGMHGQREHSIQHLNALVLLSSGGSVQHETISKIESDLRAEASENCRFVAAADVLFTRRQLWSSSPSSPYRSRQCCLDAALTVSDEVGANAGEHRSSHSYAVHG